MIHAAVRLACRNHLLALAVCTTGSTTLEATATGYARASGSFITDGFYPGMEVAPTGFTQTAAGMIEAVTALTLTIKGGRTVQAAGAGRTLTVGMPGSRFYENQKVQPVANVTHFVEQYLPGPGKKIEAGAGGEVSVFPQYVPQIHVPANTGNEAADAYADAILEHFAADTNITVNGAALRVRGDVMPFRGQLLQSSPGFAAVPVNIPMWLRYANPV